MIKFYMCVRENVARIYGLIHHWFRSRNLAQGAALKGGMCVKDQSAAHLITLPAAANSNPNPTTLIRKIDNIACSHRVGE